MPDTAAALEQDQQRQEPGPGRLVAGHIPGTAEAVGVQSADYNLLSTEHRTAGAAAGRHTRPAAHTAGTSDLLVSELLNTAAAAAELLVGALQRRRKQCYRVFLNGLP